MEAVSLKSMIMMMMMMMVVMMMIILSDTLSLGFDHEHICIKKIQASNNSVPKMCPLLMCHCASVASMPLV